MSATSQRYLVVRRWRNQAATLTLHRAGCGSVKRAEVCNHVHATSDTAAAAKATVAHYGELTVGRSHWGAECKCMTNLTSVA